ncbi:T9SS type A sorting domain-containing protein [Viscerimonas tarda]
MRKTNLLFVLFVLTSMSLHAAGIYVSASYSNSDANGSQAKPFKELYRALAVANANDVIYVAEGQYLPQTDAVNGARYSTFTIDKNLTIKGGYSTDFTTNDTKDYPTVLSGDLDGNDFYDPVIGTASSNEGNVYHVITVNADVSVLLEGITVQGGNADLNDVADKPKSQNGGGIFSLGSLKLENVIIAGNTGGSKPGAGIYSNADLEANKVVFLGNKSGNDGGGLYVKNGTAIISNCTFIGNEAASGGGALMIGGTTGTYIKNSTFYWNVTARYGTCSLYNAGTTNPVVLVNNTFVNNDISNSSNKNNGGGGAVYVNWGGNVYLVNNTIMGNKTLDGTDTGEGGAVYSRAGNIFLANNVIAGNFAPEGEDVYHNGGAQEVTSLGYNVFTYGGVNTTAIVGNNDIIAGSSKSAGLALLTQIFEGNTTDYVFEAETANNGGDTETVKIKDATATIGAGKTIASLPATQLSETTIDADLNNDGDKDDVLSIDQRNKQRDLTGKASIGSYEYYASDLTGIKSVNSNDITIYVNNGQIVINAASDYTYAVYDLTGKKQNPSSLSKGVYIVKVQSAQGESVKKIIL